VSSGPARHFSTRTIWTLTLVTTTATVLALGMIVAAGGHAGTGVIATDDIAKTVAALLACAACTFAARRGPKTLRFTWSFFAVSTFLWAAGAVAACFRDLSANAQLQNVSPSWADTGFLSAIPFTIAGLLFIPSFGNPRKASRVLAFLDAMLIAGSMLFLSWATVLGPLYASPSASTWVQLAGVAHPFGDVLKITVLLLMIARMSSRPPQFALFLSAGILLNAIAGSSFTYLTTVKNYAATNPVDAGWIAGFSLIGIAALRSLGADAPERHHRGEGRWNLQLPYIPIGLSLVIACYKLLSGAGLDGVLAWDGVILVGVVLIRQFVLVNQTTALADEIREQNLRLEETIKDRTTVLTESLETLHQANDERRRLLLRMVTSQDTEKRQIAQIIHDDMLQSVATAQLHLYTLRKKSVPEELKPAIDKADASLSASATALRGLTVDLSLQELDLGFVEAIQQCIDRERESGIENIELLNNVEGDPDRQVAAAIYRNVREALVNVRKHARTARVIVMISSTVDQYILNVSDDGPGFEVGDGESPQGHMGLSSMRERAEALGGSMHIGSKPGEGTVLEFYIPRSVHDDQPPENSGASASRPL
jgi:signal transduction histidine kinase